MAQLSINLRSIAANVAVIKCEAERNNLELVSVAKSCHDFEPALTCLDQAKPAYLGMSKLKIAARFAEQFSTPIMLTSIPTPCQARETVKYSTVSLNSNVETLAALDHAASAQGVLHGYFMMVDVGDLREGIMPNEVLPVMQKIDGMGLQNLSFKGLGTNYACANGVTPSTENLSCLYTLARELTAMGIQVPKVSLGGSSIIEWLDSDRLKGWPTQIRVGQGLLLGTIPVSEKIGSGLRTDTLSFEAQVVEVAEKPSKPSVPIGANALGIVQEREDIGTRRRGILDFGVSDTDPLALVPSEAGLVIVACNSDYTIVDLTECEREIRVGSTLTFGLKYRAMLQSFISPYLSKMVSDEAPRVETV